MYSSLSLFDFLCNENVSLDTIDLKCMENKSKTPAVQHSMTLNSRASSVRIDELPLPLFLWDVVDGTGCIHLTLPCACDPLADLPVPHNVIVKKSFMKNEAWFHAIENALLLKRTKLFIRSCCQREIPQRILCDAKQGVCGKCIANKASHAMQ